MSKQLPCRLAINCLLYLCTQWISYFAFTFHAQAKETGHLEFVQEYVRELREIERIRAKALEETQAKNADNLSDCIRNMTSFQLELGSDIRILSGMNLDPPFDDMIKGMIHLYEMKIDCLIDLFTDVLP